MYLLCDFGYKPISVVPGTPKFEKILQASKQATKKFKNKAEDAALLQDLNQSRAFRGLQPIETKPVYVAQPSRFDNIKPVDLDTRKQRKILPYKPKDDGFVSDVSLLDAAKKSNKNKYLSKALSASELENKLLNQQIDYNTQRMRDLFNKK